MFLTYYEVHGDIQGPHLVKKYPKYMLNLPTRILNIQFGASILCRDIFNDYLGSYMIETDMTVCILTCFRVNVDLQDKKSVKNMLKIQNLSSLNLEYLIWCFNINTRHLQWLSIVIYDWNWYDSMYFDLFWG